jgi:hypothetical protein
MSNTPFLGDGSFDLILVKSSWRLDFFRFLHHVAKNSQKVEKLSNVERFRATEVIIHPIITQQKERGNWACDGELITANEVRVRAHHQALNLFASGIRLDQIKKINEEESKVIRGTITEGFHWTRRFIFDPLTNILNTTSFSYSVFLPLLLLFLFVLCYYFLL